MRINLKICNKCNHLNYATGYEEGSDKQKNRKILACNLIPDENTAVIGIQILTPITGEETGEFHQEPNSTAPLNCPYYLEHVLNEQENI